jgi:hypothetical protein
MRILLGSHLELDTDLEVSNVLSLTQMMVCYACGGEFGGQAPVSAIVPPVHTALQVRAGMAATNSHRLRVPL